MVQMNCGEFINNFADDCFHLAAVESIMVGRETLEAAIHQGEQLQNAENLADETEYKLDRATRLLKGMTWAGWFANKFTDDVEPPEYKTKPDIAERQGPPRVYEDVPKSCLDIAQAVQNYYCNVDVLEECETDDQRETCKIICDNMYSIAKKQALQKKIFPKGIMCLKSKEIRTTSLSPSFELIQALKDKNVKNVTLRGVEPRFPG